MEKKPKEAQEEVAHRSGRSFYWPGSMARGDYYQSGKNSLFTHLKTSKSGQVSGGFESDLKPMTRLGTFSSLTPSEEVIPLIEKHKQQNLGGDPALIDAASRVARDRDAFFIMKKFFEDGGIFLSSGFGHYSPENLTIDINASQNSKETARVIFHELLHYAFDKLDSRLYEIHETGGLDHRAIEPLENRFLIIYSILTGNLPSLEGYSGFTMQGDLAELIEPMIKQNNLNGLQKTVESRESFYANIVRNGMLTSLSHNAVEKKEKFKLTGDQLQDLAFLNATNAELLQQSFRLAISLSRRLEIPIKDAFNQPEYYERFSAFLAGFEGKLSSDINASVYETGWSEMNKAMGSEFQRKPLE